MLKDLARALSLSNLCFMAVWPTLISLSLNPQAQYARYRFNAYVAIIINVLSLGAALWIGITLLRRYGNPLAMKVAKWAFLIFMILPLHAVIQTEWPKLALDTPAAIFGSNKRVFITILLLALAAFLVVRYRDRAVKLFSILLLLMFPFVFWTFGKTVYLMTRFNSKPSAPLIAATGDNSPRVLWLVFDEMDQRLAFSERPPDLKLPELDRFRSESFYAENAYPPAGNTLLSLPALISGKLVSSAYVTSPSDLMITFGESREYVNWAEQPNVFSEARKLGRNAALAGWYHPYDRMIGDSLTRSVFESQKERPLGQYLRNQWRSVIQSLPLALSVKPIRDMEFGKLEGAEENRKKYRVQMYKRILDEAKKTATDPDIGVAFVHWSFPHLPVIYSREKQDFKSFEGATYLDNLALVDRTLGEMRRELEAAGLWENTAVLVTSDHPWRKKKLDRESVDPLAQESVGGKRKSDPRIPFVLKLPGQKQGAVYNSEFNTVLTADLVLAILRCEVSSAESLAAWLDAHRTIGKSPYNRNRLKNGQDLED